MSRTKKIYEYKRGIVNPCPACEGTGRIEKFHGSRKCFLCGGNGGKWGTIKVLVGEEVIE